MTQNEKIISYMREHGRITQRDAIWLGCYRLSARIFDLKKEGYIIESDREKVTNTDGSTATIGVYRLREK